MPRKSAALRLAPPTSAPSTFVTAHAARGVRGLDRAAVEDAHLGALGAEALGERVRESPRAPRPRRPPWASGRCRLPTPARRRRLYWRPSQRRATSQRVCRPTTVSVSPACRSPAVSPTQTIAIKPGAVRRLRLGPHDAVQSRRAPRGVPNGRRSQPSRPRPPASRPRCRPCRRRFRRMAILAAHSELRSLGDLGQHCATSVAGGQIMTSTAALNSAAETASRTACASASCAAGRSSSSCRRPAAGWTSMASVIGIRFPGSRFDCGCRPERRPRQARQTCNFAAAALHIMPNPRSRRGSRLPHQLRGGRRECPSCPAAAQTLDHGTIPQCSTLCDAAPLAGLPRSCFARARPELRHLGRGRRVHAARAAAHSPRSAATRSAGPVPDAPSRTSSTPSRQQAGRRITADQAHAARHRQPRPGPAHRLVGHRAARQRARPRAFGQSLAEAIDRADPAFKGADGKFNTPQLREHPRPARPQRARLPAAAPAR